MTENRRALGWLLVVVIFGGVLGFFAARGISLRTDMLSLFPPSQENPLLSIIQQSMRGPTGRKVLFVIEPRDRESPGLPRRLRERLRRSFEDTPLFERVRILNSRRTGEEYASFYFPYRYQFLSPRTRRLLRSEHPLDEMSTRARRILYSSRLTGFSGLLERDPLMLFPALLQYWRKGGSSAPSAIVSLPSRVVIAAELNGSPFEVSRQRAFDRFLADLRSLLERDHSNLTLQWTGVIRFASSIRTRMQRDLNRIGVLSTAAIALLILLVFRSWKYLLLLLMPVVVGFLVAFAGTLLVWPNPHLMTIIFSTSLIGVSVDYAFHYFLESAGSSHSGRSPLGTIFPGISLGLLTTVLGYVGLGMTPLPLLRQMAFFSTVGLTAAFLTVVCWFPVMVPRGGEDVPPPFLRVLTSRILNTWDWVLNRPRVLTLSLGLLGVGCLVGLGWVSVSDDVRDFQPTPRLLMEEDRSLRRSTGFWNTGRYLFVHQPSAQQLLRRLEQLRPHLKQWRRDTLLGTVRSLLPFLPSVRRQRQDNRLLERSLQGRKEQFLERFGRLGFREPILHRTWERVMSDPDGFITPREWLRDPVSFGLRSLWFGETSRGYATLVMLRNIHDEPALRTRVAGQSGVDYVNRLQTLNRVIRSYRREATYLLVIAYAVILLVLILRYGILGGVVTALPSLLGVGVALGLLGLFGVVLNLTHVLAVLLLLGIGIDYGIFLRETRRQHRDRSTTFSAILVSAFTTAASFGLLLLSDMTLLHSIGLTVCAGLVAITVLSPLALAGGGEKR